MPMSAAGMWRWDHDVAYPSREKMTWENPWNPRKIRIKKDLVEFWMTGSKSQVFEYKGVIELSREFWVKKRIIF